MLEKPPGGTHVVLFYVLNESRVVKLCGVMTAGRKITARQKHITTVKIRNNETS